MTKHPNGIHLPGRQPTFLKKAAIYTFFLWLPATEQVVPLETAHLPANDPRRRATSWLVTPRTQILDLDVT